MTTIRYRIWAAVVLLPILTTLGCAKRSVTPARSAGWSRPIVVVSAASNVVADKTVSVDIVGVREVEHYFWDQKPVDVYWRPGDPDRTKAVKYEMREFDKRNPQELDKRDSRWDMWEQNGVRYLFVIADIPGVRDDRKLDLDLKEVGGRRIEIRVTEQKLEAVK